MSDQQEAAGEAEVDGPVLECSVMEPGVVRVGLKVTVPVEKAWLALADPVRLARWFGEIGGPWLPGSRDRIEFGDGDFFEVLTHEVTECRVIDFEWRFLGLSPIARIRWTAKVVPDGTEIAVEDRDPHRTPAESDELLTGWTDFFQRLARYLATGESCRYEWRDDIDGSVDLPSSADAALQQDTLSRWLPIASDGFVPRWFFIVDDEGPRRFRVEDWSEEPGGLRFSIEIPGAAARSRCRVTVAGNRLSFSHSGWRALELPDRRALLLRRRFTAAWVAALDQARGLAEVR
ncbi:SRPBCC family protein [Amycolatopsis sp. cmx-11-32]|uniref:SRPBCC family protein n=1 Tax=Amycolatopsis sp. cmx-11-32 TaxID=2785796 RepID=UPI0039E3FCA2